MKYSVSLFLLLVPCLYLSAQPDWKLAKDRGGIKVYLASSETSKFKSLRVLCTITGTITQLQNVLRDVSHQPQWIYKEKSAVLVKELSRNDFVYYSETEMPWPVTNRDGTYHFTMTYDSVHHAFSALVAAEPNTMAKKEGKVRVPYSKAVWKVTEADKKISIDYTLEVDPGGSLPAWLVNAFADKGAYETFKKLEQQLAGKL